jgi:hypothetical protein
LPKKKTYWFTIASGPRYREHATALVRSLNGQHIDINVLGSDSMVREESKFLKIEGILQAPENCDRIVFLDADTIVLNAEGIDSVNGSWQIPWKIPAEACIPKTLNPTRYIPKLEAFYRQNGLSVFAKGEAFEGIEWNSGVIVGDRQVMIDLANEWRRWWTQINDMFDGHFRRDQVSFRIAYYTVFKSRYQIEDLPCEYNWVASYHGINPNANILHRTMVKQAGWLEKGWNEILEKTFSGENIKTCNRLFDIKAIQNTIPCLTDCPHVNPLAAAGYLRQTVKLWSPGRVMIFGSSTENVDLLGELNRLCNPTFCTDSLVSDRSIKKDDLIVFNVFDCSRVEEFMQKIDKKAVGCLTRAHNLEFYRFLFRFSYVRFIEYNFVIFSNSAIITTWDFHDSPNDI